MRTTKICQMLTSYGADIGNRQMLFDNKVQVEFEYDLLQKTHNLNGEIELAGLVIDWHIFDNDRTGNGEVIPAYADTYQPTYAYA